MSLNQRNQLKPKCGCGIKAYASKDAAERALAKVQSLGLRDSMPKRAEQCWGLQWHIVGKRSADTGPDRSTRELVLERDDWTCACCGTPIEFAGPYSLQHRVARGAGGTSDPAINSPANLITLCGSATSPGGCHLAAESRAAISGDTGFWLHHGQDPAAVPVRHALHGWVLLDNAGGWSPAPMRGAA